MMIKYRSMKEKDVPCVVKNEKNIFNVSFGEVFYLKDINNKLASYYVMTKDEKLIGFIGIWKNGEMAQVLNFFIIREEQNNGYGKQMLKYTLDKLFAEEIKVLSLEVRISNIKAQEIYKKEGFVVSHIRKGYYKNNEDAYVLLKEL